MSRIIRGDDRGRRVLATDLDGTFIPLDGNEQNRNDLQILAGLLQEHRIELVFVSGRHRASVQQAIAIHQLPRPNWIICDVGTTIYHAVDGNVNEVHAYGEHLDAIVASLALDDLRETLSDLAGLRLQESEKQGRFKLSYYTHQTQLQTLAAEIGTRLADLHAPYSIIHSVDPFTGDGLIDLLPEGVSKAHALRWWSQHAGLADEAVIFAGDSGNDLAAMVAGYRAIIVSNATRELAERVFLAHRDSGWENRLRLAKTPATSGVLEGCRWFGLIPGENGVGVARSDGRKPLGATPVSCDQTHFRVWAPHRNSVAVCVRTEGGGHRCQPLERDWGGYFQGVLADVAAGARYQYVLDDTLQRPDPASSFQPDGVHGDSQVIDHDAFAWQDAGWNGVTKAELVIYELHVGTFTEQGDFAAAIGRLDKLQELGVTAVELMPVAQSSGRWNWGYDGVDLFAPRNTYGTPDDFKAFVDACHARRMAVILDVVYNHVGPEGNYLADFGPYFSNKHHTPWGGAFDFDGRGALPVRRFVADNAVYWLDKYHLDGLRLDAVHFMHDDSDDAILDEIRRDVAQFEQSAGRHIHLIAEANIYDPHLLADNGVGQPPYDAIWCDDIMHSVYSIATAEVKLTNREYRGWSDLLEALQHGYLYMGPRSRCVRSADRERLTPDADRRHLSSLVVALQTHDCVGNHPHGKRLHELASAEFQKAAAALVLLYPAIPLIFMGEECALPTAFHFFVDFQDKRLRRAVNRGRAREYPQHVWQGAIRPTDERAFLNAKVTTAGDRSVWDWYQALLRLRKDWQGSGGLAPSHLRVGGSCESQIVTLRYEAPGQLERFVLVRLASPTDDATPVAVQIDGQILLNSHSNDAPVGGSVIQLQASQAIIGTGSVNRVPA